MKLDERNIEVLDDEMVEVLRKKTPQERLTIAFKMWNSAKKQLAYYLRNIHPDWQEEKIQLELARRLSHGVV